MASLPYEFGWKALKDNDVGPDNHTGAAREPKGVSHIPGPSLSGPASATEVSQQRNSTRRIIRSHTWPPPLCSSFKRHRSNYRV